MGGGRGRGQDVTGSVALRGQHAAHSLVRGPVCSGVAARPADPPCGRDDRSASQAAPPPRHPPAARRAHLPEAPEHRARSAAPGKGTPGTLPAPRGSESPPGLWPRHSHRWPVCSHTGQPASGFARPRGTRERGWRALWARGRRGDRSLVPRPRRLTSHGAAGFCP